MEQTKEKEANIANTDNNTHLPLYQVGQIVHFFDEDGPQCEAITACVEINHLHYYSCQKFYSAEDVRPALFIPETKLFESRESMIATI